MALDEGLKGPFRPPAPIFAQQLPITHFGLAFQPGSCRRANETDIFLLNPGIYFRREGRTLSASDQTVS